MMELYQKLYILYIFLKENSYIPKVVRKFYELLLSPYKLHLVKKYMESFCVPDKQLAEQNEEIVVSLTTMPSRIELVHYAIWSILRQTMRPRMIVLNLSKDEMDAKQCKLPEELKHLCNSGYLSIHWVEENLMPHNKYFDSLRKYKGKCIITVDDDIWYDNHTIEHLWTLHSIYPNCVCANLVREIKFDGDKYQPYLCWKHKRAKRPIRSNNFLALGYEGVLYPPDVYKDSDVFDAKTIRETALKADDLWLKAHQLLKNIPIVTGGYVCCNLTIPSSQIVSLTSQNNGKVSQGNDNQWNSLVAKYNLVK